MSKVTRKDYVKAIKELNEKLGLDPEVSPKLPVDEMKSALMQIQGLVSDKDELSELVWKVFNSLSESEESETKEEAKEPEKVEEKPKKKVVKKKKKVVKKPKPEPEPEPEPELEPETPSEPEETETVTEPEPDPVVEEKPKKKVKKEKVKKERVLTRIDCILDVYMRNPEIKQKELITGAEGIYAKELEKEENLVAMRASVGIITKFIEKCGERDIILVWK